MYLKTEMKSDKKNPLTQNHERAFDMHLLIHNNKYGKTNENIYTQV